MKVFVCSNRECCAVLDFDPLGHCPVCLRADGVGWSCQSRTIYTKAAHDVFELVAVLKELTEALDGDGIPHRAVTRARAAIVAMEGH